jgi:membrane protein YqaA with SNARE-associated domain
MKNAAIKPPGSSKCTSMASDQLRSYRSFWKLPIMVQVSGVIIGAVGLANLVLLLLKIDWSGMLWLFFYSIAANTAISVFPHEPAIVYCGKYFNTLSVAFVCVAGNLAAGWVDHHFFTPVLQMKFSEGYRKTRIYRKTAQWFSRAPFWVIVVFALTPLPFYLVKFLAFSTGYPMRRYMTGIFVGRLPRFYLLALLGYAVRVPMWLMAAFFCGVFAVYGAMIIKGLMRAKSLKRAPVFSTEGSRQAEPE